MDRCLRALVLVAVAFFLVPAWHASSSSAQDAAAKFDPAVRPELREPMVLSSKDGVLEVRLTAKQGEARLDTVAKPVDGFLLFAYELIRGTASNGETKGENLYPVADAAGESRRDADRPSRQRHVGPDHQGLHGSELHGGRQGGAALSRGAHLVADQSARARRACEPQGQLRQRPAAHPGRHRQHLHLSHARRACRRAPIGITRICTR